MAISSSRSLLLSSCSLFMGILFAYSASIQLNDHDLYFWFPLYALASVVNLLSISFTSRNINQVAVLVAFGGTILLLKVLAEDLVYGLSGFWSMNMTQRVVREKIGSGLVVISMSLHLKASAISREPRRSIRQQKQKSFASGVALFAALSFGLSLYFFMFARDNMKL